MNMRRPVTGLQLPSVAPPEQVAIHKTWDTMSGIEGEIAMKGFVAMDTPMFECPQITEEILTTSDHEKYTTVFAQQNAWFNYVTQVYAQVSGYVLQCENEMEMIESRMRVTFRGQIKTGERDKMTKEEMQDEINLDPRYQELKLLGQTYKQKKAMLNAFVEGIERGLRLISRQVEIRKMEVEQNRVNIPGRGYERPGGPWRGRDEDRG